MIVLHKPNKKFKYIIGFLIVVIITGIILIAFMDKTATLKVTTSVPAKIYGLSEPFDSPGTTEAPAGTYPLTAYAPGYVAETTITILNSGDNNLSFELVPEPSKTTSLLSEFSAWPIYSRTNDTLYYMGNRGDAIMSYSKGAGERNITGDVIDFVTDITWSSEGNAIMRVAPPSAENDTEPYTLLYESSKNRFLNVPEITWGASASISETTICYGDYDGESSYIHTGNYVTDGSAAKIPDLRSYQLDLDVMVPICYISPDNSKVAFTSMPLERDNSNTNLYILDLNSGETTSVFTDGYISNVAWNPSSEYVLFEHIENYPVIYCYDTKQKGFTNTKIDTFLDKVTFYNDTTLIYGLPHDLETAFKSGASTPDSLMYGSILTEATGVITPYSSECPCNFTKPILTTDGSTLYYLQSLYLMSLDFTQITPVIERFSKSIEVPIEGGSK